MQSVGKTALREGVIELIPNFDAKHCGLNLNLNVNLKFYQKKAFTHLVLRSRQIDHILINVNTSLRRRNCLKKLC